MDQDQANHFSATHYRKLGLMRTTLVYSLVRTEKRAAAALGDLGTHVRARGVHVGLPAAARGSAQRAHGSLHPCDPAWHDGDVRGLFLGKRRPAGLVGVALPASAAEPDRHHPRRDRVRTRATFRLARCRPRSETAPREPLPGLSPSVVAGDQRRLLALLMNCCAGRGG